MFCSTIGKDQGDPAQAVVAGLVPPIPGVREPRHERHAAQRVHLVDSVVVREGETDLLQVVGALSPASGLTRRLHGGQEQRDQDGDDGDDDQ